MRGKRNINREMQVEKESTRLWGIQKRGRRVEVSFSQERKGKKEERFCDFQFLVEVAARSPQERARRKVLPSCLRYKARIHVTRKNKAEYQA